MLLFYLPTKKTLPTERTSLCHHLTLLLAKKNTKLKRFYATVELGPTASS